MPGFQIDHSIPTIWVQLEDEDWGPGFWKLNSSLLEDKEFVEQLSQMLDIELAQDSSDKQTKWEVLKLTIKSFTLKFVARKQKAKTNELMALERKLKQVENQVHVRSVFDDVEEQIL